MSRRSDHYDIRKASSNFDHIQQFPAPSEGYTNAATDLRATIYNDSARDPRERHYLGLPRMSATSGNLASRSAGNQSAPSRPERTRPTAQQPTHRPFMTGPPQYEHYADSSENVYAPEFTAAQSADRHPAQAATNPRYGKNFRDPVYPVPLLQPNTSSRRGSTQTTALDRRLRKDLAPPSQIPYKRPGEPGDRNDYTSYTESSFSSTHEGRGTVYRHTYSQPKTNDARLQQHPVPPRAPTHAPTTGHLHPMYPDATPLNMHSEASYRHAASAGTAGVFGTNTRPDRLPGAGERDRTMLEPVQQPSGAVMSHQKAMTSHGGGKPTHNVPTLCPQRPISTVNAPSKQGTGRGGGSVSDSLSSRESEDAHTPAYKGFSRWKRAVHGRGTRRDMQKLANQMASQGYHGVDDLKVSSNYKLVRHAQKAESPRNRWWSLREPNHVRNPSSKKMSPYSKTDAAWDKHVKKWEKNSR